MKTSVSRSNRGNPLFPDGLAGKATRRMALLLLAIVLCGNVFAGETWQAALARMPLNTPAASFNATNCIQLMLNAFQSNGVVKALIFMPGATDEFYIFHRAHPHLENPRPSLADAVAALTNETYIRADYQSPFLLLHTTADALDPIAVVKSKSLAAKLRARIVPGRLVFDDCEWDDMRSALKGKLRVRLRPLSNRPDTWHFYRDSFAACGLSQWELLEAIALAGKTGFTLHWWAAEFYLDPRTGPVPGTESMPAVP